MVHLPAEAQRAEVSSMGGGGEAGESLIYLPGSLHIEGHVVVGGPGTGTVWISPSRAAPGPHAVLTFQSRWP